MKNIQSEIRKLWKSHLNSMDVKMDRGWKPFHIEIDRVYREESRTARVVLQPWLSILEECICWMSYLNVWLVEKHESGEDVLFSIFLTGNLSAQCTSIHRLVVSGLDVQARSILRSLIEATALTIVLIDCPEMAKEYFSAEDSRFWYKYVRRGNLYKKLKLIYEEAGVPTETAYRVQKWFSDISRELSSAVHSSAMASIWASMPVSASEPGMHRIGCLGRATPASIYTLQSASTAIFYFSLLVVHLLLEKNKVNWKAPPRPFDKSNSIETGLAIGYKVISTLVSKYSQNNEFGRSSLPEV